MCALTIIKPRKYHRHHHTAADSVAKPGCPLDAKSNCRNSLLTWAG